MLVFSIRNRSSDRATKRRSCARSPTLGCFVDAPAIRGAAEKRPWLKRVSRKPLAFEDYYRTHAPRPFVYYVFYPLLFPYWLTNKEARREFIVFRGYTTFGLIVLLISGSYQW